MNRTMKNAALCGVMALSVVLIVLTVLHGYGVIGNAKRNFENLADRENAGGFGGMPGDFGGGDGDGEMIGDVELPDGGADLDQEMQMPGDLPSGGMPGDMTIGGNDPMGRGDGLQNAAMGAQGSLGGHVLFVAIWIFLFAFALAWLIFSRGNAQRKGAYAWNSGPASNGTN